MCVVLNVHFVYKRKCKNVRCSSLFLCIFNLCIVSIGVLMSKSTDYTLLDMIITSIYEINNHKRSLYVNALF